MKVWSRFEMKFSQKTSIVLHQIASENHTLWLVGWIIADGTNFFEILVQFPNFPSFQIYARSGDCIRILNLRQKKHIKKNFCQIDVGISWATWTSVQSCVQRPCDIIEKLHKIGSLMARSGLAIQSLLKFYFRDHL